MILLPRIIAPPGDYWVVNGRGKYGTRRKTVSSGKLWHLLVGEINPIQVGCLKYPFISWHLIFQFWVQKLGLSHNNKLRKKWHTQNTNWTRLTTEINIAGWNLLDFQPSGNLQKFQPNWKSNCGSKNFLVKTFWVKENLGWEIFRYKQILSKKDIFSKKKVWVQKYF